ncbi:urea ABC transporter permease subunit UrtB [Pseudohongiella acticola]|uniref:urea ABC transporter permease subunit UrtB n=1 Tax=Pseudohongiella acticola TaxID=1524254 RepID=UPI0030EE1078
MRTLCLLICCFVFRLAAAQQAPESEQSTVAANDNPLTPLLQELTDANLRRMPSLVSEIEQAGGRAVLPLFMALQDGALYYHSDSLELVERRESDGGRVTLTDVFDGDVLTDIDADALEQVRINNRLRAVLQASVARIRLVHGNDAEREQAARIMLSDLDEDNLVLLNEAIADEQIPAVAAMINVALAMNVLVTDAPQTDRLAAVATLHGNLQGPVRNLLRSFLDELGRNEQDPEVRSAMASAMASIERKVRFYELMEQAFYGLSLGSVLLLAAIGLAVTFGVMGVINMAHGEMLMLGAYTTYVVQMLMPEFINYSLWVAIPAAFAVSGLVGMFIQRFVIRYLNGRPLETLLATFGISLILQQAVRTIFSPLNRLVVSPDWMSGSWDINPVLSLTNNRLFILLFSVIVFVILLWILRKTSLGLQVRAVSQNRDMAKAMGIRTDWVDAMTFGLGSGIAGIAGVALSQLTNVGPNLGQDYIIDSFMVVVFGGVGNLWGTLVGAFSLGVANKFMEPMTGAVLAKIITLVFIILFIQVRPKGLFPQKGRAAE